MIEIPNELKAIAGGDNYYPLAIGGEEEGACPNCGGLGLVYIFVPETRPSRQPHARKGIINHYLDFGEGDSRTGWYGGKTYSAPCPVCQRDVHIKSLFETSGLTEADYKTNFTNFKAMEGKKDALTAAKTAAKERKGLYLFYGSNGRGKTHLLKAITNAALRAGIEAKYVSLPDLLSDIRSGYSEDKRGAAEEHLYIYRSVPVLCVDELDKVNMTDWAGETIYRLLDHRYSVMDAMLTVLATEAEPNELVGNMSYLASRIKAGVVIQVGGVDVREIMGEKKKQSVLH